MRRDAVHAFEAVSGSIKRSKQRSEQVEEPHSSSQRP
jgi:hypothetical protein